MYIYVFLGEIGEKRGLKCSISIIAEKQLDNFAMFCYSSRK